jgi:hypothetical protein
MRKWVWPAVLAFALAAALGCVGTPNWEKPEATSEDYKHDSARCMNEASGVALDPSASNRARVEADFERCMEARGWTRRKP